MSAIFAITTIVEIAVAVLLIWGFINERKIVAFEDKLARAIAIHIRNHRRRKLAEQRRQMQQHQSRMPADPVFVPIDQPVAVRRKDSPAA